MSIYDDVYENVWQTESKGPDSLVGIESPDLSKMIPLRIDRNTVMYFRTQEKLIEVQDRLTQEKRINIQKVF